MGVSWFWGLQGIKSSVLAVIKLGFELSWRGFPGAGGTVSPVLETKTRRPADRFLVILGHSACLRVRLEFIALYVLCLLKCVHFIFKQIYVSTSLGDIPQGFLP